MLPEWLIILQNITPVPCLFSICAFITPPWAFRISHLNYVCSPQLSPLILNRPPLVYTSRPLSNRSISHQVYYVIPLFICSLLGFPSPTESSPSKTPSACLLLQALPHTPMPQAGCSRADSACPAPSCLYVLAVLPSLPDMMLFSRRGSLWLIH